MDTEDNLAALLAEHHALRKTMPRTWNAFFARFRSLRPIQLKVMPAILSGTNVLVTAPTAGGKTEASLAPVCERLLHYQWPGLSVLLITPTRALVNDLFCRLSQPCEQLGIRLGRKTADYGLGDEIREQVLITTPESTESLLTFRRECLASVQVVILDEVHLLDGTPRGDQLRSILSRLSVYRHNITESGFSGLQRIAMSATVSNPRRLADAYTGDRSQLISVGGQRDLDAKVILVEGSDKVRAESAVAALDAFGSVSKVLVFVNSRKQVDTGAGDFRCGRFSKAPVYGHHGSLSKQQREEIETRFKSDPIAICVATMTLEVGIDIGDIDLIICIDPPFSLSSFLQRIGRGCRRLQGKTRVLCVARDRRSELMFHALIRQAALGIPAGPVNPYRRSVLVQQVLAYLRQVPTHRRVIDQFMAVLKSEACPAINEECIRAILGDMVQNGYVDERGSIYQPATAGWEFIESNSIYTNIQPTPLEVALVDVETGQVVASVAAVDGSAGVRVAGRSYDFLPGGSATEKRVRAGGDHTSSPRYHARTLPYASDLGASLAALLGIQSNELAVMRAGDTLVTMTWLGRLLNAVLAVALRRQGHDVADGAFQLSIRNGDETGIVGALHNAVEDVLLKNPLAGMAVERMVDLGPHFDCLSALLQSKSREDWLDSDFLRKWIDGIQEVKIVDPGSSLADDLVSLIM
jgi:ATP-dependent Lhr-like helicase